MRRRWAVLAGALALACVFAARPLAQNRSAAVYQWTLPPRVPPPRVPLSAPVTPTRVELGRRLFYDRRLSGNGTQACATCHVQEKAFTDGRALGLGSTGMVHPRSPMSLINVAYRDTLTWANPNQRVLEEQALEPMLGETPIEPGMKGHEARIYAALGRDPVYQRLFPLAFPEVSGDISTATVATALAAFERSIVSFRSPFDRYRQDEDTTALSESAARGMVLFFSGRRTGCTNCHRGLNLDGGTKDVTSPTDREALRDPRWSDPWN